MESSFNGRHYVQSTAQAQSSDLNSNIGVTIFICITLDILTNKTIKSNLEMSPDFRAR